MDVKEKLSSIVILNWKRMFGQDMSDTQILATDPNDFDIDPCMFYETMDDVLGLDFGSFGPEELGETIEETIERVLPLWDGESENEVELWFDEEEVYIL